MSSEAVSQTVPEAESLDTYRIMGARAKAAARLLDWRLANFDRYSQTFGYHQWLKKNPLTPEQLVAFEDGYRYISIKK